MPLIFNLIVNKNTEYQIKKIVLTLSDELMFGHNDLLLYFTNLNLSIDEANTLIFMYNNKEIKGPNMIRMNNDDIVIINVLTNNIMLTDKLVDVFNKHGISININNNPNPNKEVNPNKTKSKQIPEEIIDSQNDKTIKLFNDPDFRTLMKIYLTKPEMFNILLQFTQNGDIIELEQHHQISDTKLKELFLQIKNLNINVSDEIIINKLKCYNGHLNLTLRSILCDICKN
jgi:hypothetical protein